MALAVLGVWILARGGPAGSQPALPIEVTGATFLEYDDRTGQLRAEGAPVVVTRGRTTLRAPRVRYDARTQVALATGGVTVEEPALAVRAEEAEFRFADDRFRAWGQVVVRSRRDDQTTTLSAPQMEGSLQTRRFAASGGVAVDRGEWRVRGRWLDYDDGTGVAVVTGDPEARFGEATMTAGVIRFNVRDETASGEGGVWLRRGELEGRAARADVAGREGRAVLSGGARVDRGADRLTAEVIEVDLDGSRATARGRSRLVVVPR
ncbi:MAG: hypothetical protein QN187_11050 [Armatimonadota bacterium]|nr:hypothetical protein [Armatimonadota bacterium]MDR7519325.1 hypothetical protein [Armatimonadota bacterium]MDR7549414.1 hypothetical protein [Armatimonadota bacterium]